MKAKRTEKEQLLVISKWITRSKDIETFDKRCERFAILLDKLEKVELSLPEGPKPWN